MAVLLPSVRSHRPGTIGVSVLALAATIGLLYFGRVFFITITVSVVLAFILEPFVELLMRVRFPRAVASFVVCSLALLVLYLAGLGFYLQGVALTEEFPKYSQRVGELVDAVVEKAEAFERRSQELLLPRRIQQQNEAQAQAQAQAQIEAQAQANARRRRPAEAALPLMGPGPIQEVRIRQDGSPIVSFLYSRLGRVYIFLLMASFVPFLVYFMLSWRDHLYRSFMRLFESEERVIADRTWEGIASMVRGFVVGNFVLATLLAIASSIIFWLMGLPYAFLIGPLSGFLSIVPYLGLPLAMLPPFFAALTIYTGLGAYVAIGSVVAVLHLLALNLLYPKVVGARVHLNPLAVTIALMFWTVLWGEVGLILAIPITAGIKAVCDNITNLQPYGKLLGD